MFVFQPHKKKKICWLLLSADCCLGLQEWETQEILDFIPMCLDIPSFTREKNGRWDLF